MRLVDEDVVCFALTGMLEGDVDQLFFKL